MEVRQLRLFSAPPTVETKLTLMEVFERYHLGRHPDLGPLAAQQIRTAIRLLSRFLEREALPSDLTDQLVRQFMLWCASPRLWPTKHKPDRIVERLAPATINQKRSQLLQVWRTCTKEGFSPHAVEEYEAEDLPRLHEPDYDPVAWEMPEVHRLFRAIAQTPGQWQTDGGAPLACQEGWLIGALLVWDTGIRCRTLLALERPQLDVEQRRLFVPAEQMKGSPADRTFSLHEQTVRVIVESFTRAPRVKIFPFPYAPRSIWKQWHKILDRAGLQRGRKYGLHCLRRTTESHATAAAGIEFAAEAIGHSVQVARKSYISRRIVRPKAALIDVLPRPEIPTAASS